MLLNSAIAESLDTDSSVTKSGHVAAYRQMGLVGRLNLHKREFSLGFLVVEHRQVELLEVLGVGNYFHLDNLPVRDCEPQHPQQPSTRSEH